jgi:hypothetical protein
MVIRLILTALFLLIPLSGMAFTPDDAVRLLQSQNCPTEFWLVMHPSPNAAMSDKGVLFATLGLFAVGSDSQIMAVLLHEVGHCKMDQRKGAIIPPPYDEWYADEYAVREGLLLNQDLREAMSTFLLHIVITHKDGIDSNDGVHGFYRERILYLNLSVMYPPQA